MASTCGLGSPPLDFCAQLLNQITPSLNRLTNAVVGTSPFFGNPLRTGAEATLVRDVRHRCSQVVYPFKPKSGAASKRIWRKRRQIEWQLGRVRQSDECVSKTVNIIVRYRRKLFDDSRQELLDALKSLHFPDLLLASKALHLFLCGVSLNRRLFNLAINCHVCDGGSKNCARGTYDRAEKRRFDFPIPIVVGD